MHCPAIKTSSAPASLQQTPSRPPMATPPEEGPCWHSRPCAQGALAVRQGAAGPGGGTAAATTGSKGERSALLNDAEE